MIISNHYASIARNKCTQNRKCLSARMIQLENRWTGLDEIWYGRYVSEDTL
jgi:hypothetical protein